MRNHNLTNALDWHRLTLFLYIVRYILAGSIFLLIMFFIVLGIDKERENIGFGVVIECLPVRNNFFLGEIHRGSVRVGREIIENARLTNCLEDKRVFVIRKHKHWGFKSYYSAR